MLTQLEVYRPSIAVAPFPATAGSAMTDALQIRNIDGLNPVPADISSSKSGATDGVSFTSTTTGSRTITVRVALKPNWSTQTPESLRRMLYSYFMPKAPVTLRFASNDLPTVDISGIVETVEPVLFTDDPEFLVTIQCPKPSFVATTSTAVSGTTEANSSSNFFEYTYDGNADTGFVLFVEKGAAADISSAQIRLVVANSTQKTFVIDGMAINANQFLQVSTVPLERSAKLMPTVPGLGSNVLAKVNALSAWPILEPGLNRIRVSTPVAGNAWTIRFFKRYGGL